MYEEFFGMTHRPFLSNPNAAEFTAIGPVQEALESVLNCLTHYHGVAVVTGASGMGKTAFCRHVAHILRDTHQTAYPTAASLETRRAFLQSILYELGADYLGLDEDDARLRLFAAAQESRRQGKLLLLIIDDAHLLHPRLLDELRSLADYAPSGESLFRIMLCGQFALEETLADPMQSSFTQRIGAHVCLESYSMEQSARFLVDRLRNAGVEDLTTVMTPEAMESICRAADGNLRCLCQLADHSLLLAFAQECRPVDERIVQAALDDLRGLPLSWGTASHEPAGDLASAEGARDTAVPEFPAEVLTPAAAADDGVRPETGNHFWGASDSFNTALPADHSVAYAVIEVGADQSGVSQVMGVQTPLSEVAVAKLATSSRQPLLAEFSPFALEEIPVTDRYAALDRIAELPEEKRGTVQIPPADSRTTFDSSGIPDPSDVDSLENCLLGSVQMMLQEIRHSEATVGVRATPPEKGQTAEPERKSPAAPGDADSQGGVERRFGRLFTRLRERRRQLGGQ